MGPFILPITYNKETLVEFTIFFNSIIKERSRSQIIILIADYCFSNVTTQWVLKIFSLQSYFARKTKDHVWHDKWPLPIWGCSYNVTYWHNFNLPFKQALPHLNVLFQTIPCLLESKSEFHNFTIMVCKQKLWILTSSTWTKVFLGIQSIPSEIRVFKCKQASTTSRAKFQVLQKQ